MKKLTSLSLILLLAVLAIFCLTSCVNGDSVTYNVTVDNTQVSAETGSVSARVYALDGTQVATSDLTDKKASFSLKPDDYVVTLVGLDETVSFSSVLLTKDKRNATITLANSDYDEFAEVYSFAFTVIMYNGKWKLDDLSALICDIVACRDVHFDKGNVVDIALSGGDCSVEVFDADKVEIYNQEFTLDLDARFHVIAL